MCCIDQLIRALWRLCHKARILTQASANNVLLEKAGHRVKAMKATDRGTPIDKPWFDQETGTLMLDEYVVEMDSYRRIVEDETITDDELVEQTQRVASLLTADCDDGAPDMVES